MIDSVGSNNFRPPPPPPNASGVNSSLSDEQSSVIEETLANFDADNLTAEDASSIVDAFSSAGIQPGAELAETLSDAGFDAREIGELANVGANAGNPPPPPPPNEELDLSAVSSFLDVFCATFSGHFSKGHFIVNWRHIQVSGMQPI